MKSSHLLKLQTTQLATLMRLPLRAPTEALGTRAGLRSTAGSNAFDLHRYWPPAPRPGEKLRHNRLRNHSNVHPLLVKGWNWFLNPLGVHGFLRESKNQKSSYKNP